MVDGRRRDDWNHTASLLWAVISYSFHCDPKNSGNPQRFNPYHEPQKNQPSEAAPLADLKVDWLKATKGIRGEAGGKRHVQHVLRPAAGPEASEGRNEVAAIQSRKFCPATCEVVDPQAPSDCRSGESAE